MLVVFSTLIKRHIHTTHTHTKTQTKQNSYHKRMVVGRDLFTQTVWHFGCRWKEPNKRDVYFVFYHYGLIMDLIKNMDVVVYVKRKCDCDMTGMHTRIVFGKKEMFQTCNHTSAITKVRISIEKINDKPWFEYIGFKHPSRMQLKHS